MLTWLSDGMVLQINKTAQTAGKLYCYIYLLMDAQVNTLDGRYKAALC
jgi:hypothetical protein